MGGNAWSRRRGTFRRPPVCTESRTQQQVSITITWLSGIADRETSWAGTLVLSGMRDRGIYRGSTNDIHDQPCLIELTAPAEPAQATVDLTCYVGPPGPAIGSGNTNGWAQPLPFTSEEGELFFPDEHAGSGSFSYQIESFVP